MNNKELTELKKIYFDRIEREQFQALDEVWDFFLPHLKSNDEIKREVGHCRLCNKEAYCVYNINLKAISICESCGRAIAKQELDDMFQTQKENNE